MDKPSLDTARCPLCGELNHCAMSADPEATECWCESLTFPLKLLEQVPKDAVRRACICQACLEKYLESTDPPGDSHSGDFEE